MSFYVTLPSTASANIHPDNTQSNFTTQLTKPLILDTPFEVALTEITYTATLSVPLGSITITNPFFCLTADSEYEIPITVINGTKAEVFFDNLNKLIKKFVITQEYAFRYQLSFNVTNEIAKSFNKIHSQEIESLKRWKFTVFKRNNLFEIIDINDNNSVSNIYKDCGGVYNLSENKFIFTNLDDLEKKADLLIFNLIDNSFIDDTIQSTEISIILKSSTNKIYDEICEKYDKARIDNKIPFFHFENANLQIFYSNVDKIVVINGLFAVLIGNTESCIIDKSVLYKFPEYLNILNYAAIYSDLIDEQLIGDTLAPVLRIINLNTSNLGDTITFFDNPHYVPVNKTFIRSINIKITDLKGESIHFESLFGFVILKLHFRKIL